MKKFALARIHAVVRTPAGGLMAPVFWSGNRIEFAPGESRTLSASLPGNTATPIVQVEGWNVTLIDATAAH
jgi:Exo-beta-D-glucosaminidase Ig-fold domain